MFKTMREYDRKLHTHFDELLFYKEIYLLDGGFEKFFKEYAHLCDGVYVAMKDKENKDIGK